ncbi:hypothetical protein C8J56DRAFT_790408 [Mycena floridula]|nr:hypothetical protein C8J56DRAFT_790408 [Mycena floridula]
MALPYLDPVTRETLRTKAVLREISREVVQDDSIPLQFPIPGTDIRDLHVKAGLIIEVPVRDGINVDERIWGPSASIFVPDRWLREGALPESVELIRAQGRLLTFGDG